MELPRASGVLLHPSSLPSSSGIGSLGEPAFQFIDWLSETKQTLWQMLPIGPTSYGDSPYASISSFAGNPLLIDLQDLSQKGFLGINSNNFTHKTVASKINFSDVYFWKQPLLEQAASCFLKSENKELLELYTNFKNEQKFWLEDYTFYITIKKQYNAKAEQENNTQSIWYEYWPDNLKFRNQDALQNWKDHYSNEMEIHSVIQFFFFEQWNQLRKYAQKKGILIIGDIPIFVSSDSADLWANQELFQLNEQGKPEYVAGVPPDYFSSTGQLWGNPLYRWDIHEKSNFSWWKERLKHMVNLFDYIRIDHFRGFESYWAIPSGSKTAETGKWEKGPGLSFFSSIQNELGSLPFIAEDLGVITKEVEILRDTFSLPGMKIIQFAFSSDELINDSVTNNFLPHFYTKNCVVYTGTHDNDTTLGWLNTQDQHTLSFIRQYLQTTQTKKKLVFSLIAMGMASVAAFAIFPIQDILALPTASRMNTPSTVGKNWSWRLSRPLQKAKITNWLKHNTILYSRNTNL